MSGLLEYDDEEKQEFIVQNPVPADKEKYLPIGALLIATHDEHWQTLNMMEDNSYWESILDNGWDIGDIDEGRGIFGIASGKRSVIK